MEKESISKHYADVANRYDNLYGFSYHYVADFAIKHLKLQPDDHLADIGAGTGAIASLIRKKAGLINPPLCVEPSASMLEVAKARDGITTCLASADGFLDDYMTRPKIYNKVLINECSHLFPNRLETFRKVYQCLPDDGLLLLILRSGQCGFPMWRELRERRSPASDSVNAFEASLSNAGFVVTMTIETSLTSTTKREWYSKLRKRMFTVLSEFSDEEIEEGIQELDQEWFPEKKEDDTVEFVDDVVFFIATKK